LAVQAKEKEVNLLKSLQNKPITSRNHKSHIHEKEEAKRHQQKMAAVQGNGKHKADLKGQKATHEREIKKLREEKKKLQTDNEELKVRNEQLVVKVNTAEQKSAHERQARVTLNTDKTTVEGEKESLELEKQSVEKELADLKEEHKTAQARIVALEASLEGAACVDTVNQEMADLSRRHDILLKSEKEVLEQNQLLEEHLKLALNELKKNNQSAGWEQSKDVVAKLNDYVGRMGYRETKFLHSEAQVEVFMKECYAAIVKRMPNLADPNHADYVSEKDFIRIYTPVAVAKLNSRRQFSQTMMLEAVKSEC